LWTLPWRIGRTDDRGMISASAEAVPRGKSRLSVLLTEVQCVLRTGWMLMRDRIALPREVVGALVVFADGSRSVVYRETAMRHRHDDGLVLIVVGFKLRFIGLNRLAHWLFRFESLFNTLLFAAYPGFETKLWLTDRDTAYYRGIYEWRGRPAGIEYAENLRVVLRPWVCEGSFAYHVIDGVTRAEYLDGMASGGGSRPGDEWWRAASSSQLVAWADESR
ncbi:MAG: hypothetical protein WAL25_04140, partial [Acidimicrobiia bacterium]